MPFHISQNKLLSLVSHAGPNIIYDSCLTSTRISLSQQERSFWSSKDELHPPVSAPKTKLWIEVNTVEREHMNKDNDHGKNRLKCSYMSPIQSTIKMFQLTQPPYLKNKKGGSLWKSKKSS